MSGGYDETANQVNAAYRRTGDIRQKMREMRLPFDVVWECLGYRDDVDWMSMETSG